MQVKNAVSASLMRQSDVLSGVFLLIKSTVWYAVCQDNCSEPLNFSTVFGQE